MDKIPGIVLSCDPLRARVVDNCHRFSHITDSIVDGLSGVASLIHEDQNKNIYSDVGLNYECASTDPPAGKHQEDSYLFCMMSASLKIGGCMARREWTESSFLVGLCVPKTVR